MEQTESKELTNYEDIRRLAELPDKVSAMVQFKAIVLDRQPDSKFVEANKYAGNSKFLGIGYIEQMLDLIDPCWSFLPVDRGVYGNSFIYEGLLELTHPLTGDKIRRTGIGAVPIELDAKRATSAIDFEHINPKAMHKNVPAARSYALKNAAQSIGDIFGRNLNRNGMKLSLIHI